jgi:hypothetical protein
LSFSQHQHQFQHSHAQSGTRLPAATTPAATSDWPSAVAPALSGALFITLGPSSGSSAVQRCAWQPCREGGTGGTGSTGGGSRVAHAAWDLRRTSASRSSRSYQVALVVYRVLPMPAPVIQESLPVHARSGVTVRRRYIVAAGRTKVFRVQVPPSPMGRRGLTLVSSTWGRAASLLQRRRISVLGTDADSLRLTDCAKTLSIKIECRARRRRHTLAGEGSNVGGIRSGPPPNLLRELASGDTDAEWDDCQRLSSSFQGLRLVRTVLPATYIGLGIVAVVETFFFHSPSRHSKDLPVHTFASAFRFTGPRVIIDTFNHLHALRFSPRP